MATHVRLTKDAVHRDPSLPGWRVKPPNAEPKAGTRGVPAKAYATLHTGSGKKFDGRTLTGSATRVVTKV